MVRVAGDVSGRGALDLADSVGVTVPDGFTFAVRFPRTLDLISGGGRAPEKVLGKLIWFGWNAGSEGKIVRLELVVLIEGESDSLEIGPGEQRGGKTASGYAKEFSAIHASS